MRDPRINPLALLSDAERADYDLFRRKGFRRAEALAQIGRGDILRGRA